MFKQKGQIQIVFIVVAVGVIAGLFFLFNSLVKFGKEGKIGEEKTVANLNDVASPQRSSLLPSGILAVGTKEVNLSLATDEPSYCRYSIKADEPYINMSKGLYSDKNKTSHSVKTTGLESNKTYKYYVRCRDLAGNKNEDDAIIEFSIGAVAPPGGATGSSAPPPAEAPPMRSNLLPSGTLSSGTAKTTIGLSTNEPAYCRYSINPETSYDRMDKGFSQDTSKLQHTATVGGLVDNKIYEYYIRCRDLNNNKNNDDVVIRFSVGGTLPGQTSPSGADITPPGRFSASPTKDLVAGTRQTNISLKTDERAICRYSETAGINYGSMKIFSVTDSTSHSTEALGLSDGGSYKYYVRCADQLGNQNTNDFTVSFKVKAVKDETPPILRNPSHAGTVLFVDTTEVVISITTNEPATCRHATTQGVSYGSMSGKFSYYDQTKIFHISTIKGLKPGQARDFFVRCQDLAGNVNTGDVLISFSIAPY